MTKELKCADCPGVADRREADAKYRAMVMTKLENYDIVLDKIDKALIGVANNFNIIYFRIGMVSGTIGLITGTVAALATLHFHK